MNETVDLTKLRAPFPPEYVGKLPRVTCRACSERNTQCDKHSKTECAVCGNWLGKHIHLDYVGHADVTIRLLEVDPEWSWAPKSTDADPELLKAAIAAGNPEIVRAVIENAPPKFETDRNGNPVGLWITLTVGGVTRLGVGSCPSGQNDAEKVLIGDALRNAAMRFGVAVELWAKGDRADPTAENATASAGQASRRGSALSAADAFETAAPARPPQQRNSQPRTQGPHPVPAQDEHPAENGADWSRWLQGAITLAPKHATLDACTAAWNRSAELVKEGKLTREQVAPLQGALRKRMTELRAAGATPGDSNNATAPELGDDWRDKVAGIQGGADGDAVIEEATQLLRDGELGASLLAAIEAAVSTRIAELSGQQVAA